MYNIVNQLNAIMVWSVYHKINTIIVPLILFSISLHAQTGIQAPVKFKIEDGDFTESSVVVRNVTTGESNTLSGTSRLNILLKPNCDYLISFQKPGYITKRIAFNTTAPSDRTSQGFYPFPFEVNLFKQYDGINIVVFNQPVGKIEFNRLIDDFDYDTDYTKQIHSALKEAEEALIARQAEERKLADQQKKEEEKRKEEEAKIAKAEQKVAAEAKRQADAQARQQALAEAQLKKKEEEENRRKAQAALAEEKRQQALARMEEEERSRLKAQEEEEARRNAAQDNGKEGPMAMGSGIEGDDKRPAPNTASGVDNGRANPALNTSTDPDKGVKAKGFSGGDPHNRLEAQVVAGTDQEITKASSVSGADPEPENELADGKSPDSKPSPTPLKQSEGHRPALSSGYEVMPETFVETLHESGRVITRVTVRKGFGSVVFSRIQYDWGGVFYFKNRMSITESHFVWATGVK